MPLDVALWPMTGVHQVASLSTPLGRGEPHASAVLQ